MLVRKNTKAFKTILEIITACQDKQDREKLIRLYITRAGDSLKERISVEGIQGEADLFYEMNYQAVLNNLRSSNHQLHVSDEFPGIYFFHSTSNKTWDETPFEFDEAIKKEFGSLPDLPVVRKKEKADKFVLPTANRTTTSTATKKEKKPATKPVKASEKGPKQPDYKLKHAIHFTGLDRVIFRQASLTKQDVLNYYNNIAEYLLPYLKDRPVWARLQADIPREPVAIHALFEKNNDSVPDWVRQTTIPKDKQKEPVVLCNDREHILLSVEKGCLEFDPCHSKIKSFDSPDYLVIAVDSPDTEMTKAVDVMIAAKDIFDGLQLPSFVKTDGRSGLHIYIPLDSKSDFGASGEAAGHLCKLIRLKIPHLVTITGTEDYVYGRVTLDYSLNKEGGNMVAPYSLVPGQSANVATPLLWEEVKEDLRLEDFNPETIFKRLKHTGDPFETLFKKKLHAGALLQRLEENYAFLF